MRSHPLPHRHASTASSDSAPDRERDVQARFQDQRVLVAPLCAKSPLPHARSPGDDHEESARCATGRQASASSRRGRLRETAPRRPPSAQAELLQETARAVSLASEHPKQFLGAVRQRQADTRRRIRIRYSYDSLVLLVNGTIKRQV